MQSKAMLQKKTKPEGTTAVQNEKSPPTTTCKHATIANMINLSENNN